ncbi:hypothetical protein [Amycolatopsis sp. NPDC059021]
MPAAQGIFRRYRQDDRPKWTLRATFTVLPSLWLAERASRLARRRPNLF